MGAHYEDEHFLWCLFCSVSYSNHLFETVEKHNEFCVPVLLVQPGCDSA